MTDYNARIELDSRDFDDSATDALTDVVADYHGVVARAVHGGRVELIFTVPADTLRQAVLTALSIVLATGHQVHGIEVLPTETFHERVDAAPVPELLSVPQAAEVLGVSRQRALQLASGGQLDAVKVGDTWAIPRRSVLARDEQTGRTWSGFVLPWGTYDRNGRYVQPDTLTPASQYLPVYDEAGSLIGTAQLSAHPGGLGAQGVVRGAPPGEYAITPEIHVTEQVHDGEHLVIKRGTLKGLTLHLRDEYQPAYPNTTAQVTNTRTRLDLSTVPQPAEVLSYP